MKALIIRCAEMCRDGYGDEELANHYNVKDLRFAYQDGVLMFRGTANKANVLRDLSILPARTIKGHLAHRGFVGAVDDLVSDVARVVPHAERNKIIVTGHSLGGATALLFAELFGCHAITFGCPRTYFRFGSKPEIQHTRIICDDDPVPMIPRIMYRHLHPAQELKDRDGGIDLKDHGIKVYLQRLKA